MPPCAIGHFQSSFVTDHLFSVLDEVNIGVAVFDRRLRFRSVNRVLAEIHGVPPQAHPGTPLHQLVGRLATDVGASLEHVFRTRQLLSNVRISGQLPKRTEPGQWIDYFFPLVDACGKVVEAGVLVLELKSRPIAKGAANPCEIALSEVGGHTDVVLTGRERDVLGLLASGRSNKEVSSILGISVKTVETYRSRLMLKVQAPSLVHLVHYAVRHHVIEIA